MSPVVLRRRGAVGDVLLTTPLIRAIRKSHPARPVIVQTDWPELFAHRKDVHAQRELCAPPGALVIDLDGAYENRPGMHIVEAYECAAREALPGLKAVKRVTDLKPGRHARQWARHTHRSLCGWRGKLCVIHAGPSSWAGKNWPRARFAELASWLRGEGWQVVAVGFSEHAPPLEHCVDLTDRTTLEQLAALLERARLFVGIDSFPMHCAQAVGCPTVGLFGVTDARYVMTEGSAHIGINADPSVPCAGLRHRAAGETLLECSAECIESIGVDQVIGAVKTLTRARWRYFV